MQMLLYGSAGSVLFMLTMVLASPVSFADMSLICTSFVSGVFVHHADLIKEQSYAPHHL